MNKQEIVNPIAKRAVNDGVQKIYRFPNGYGASVVRHRFSYGHEEGLWEIGVVKFDRRFKNNPYKFKLVYNTPITDNVIGWQDEAEIAEILERISEL